jgi:hypothetical protein
VLDAPFTVATGVYRYAMASDGDEAMVVWCSLTELRTVRITAGGAAIAPPDAVATFAFGAWIGPIAFDGRRYIVSWARYESAPCTHCIGTQADPFITFVDTDGRGTSTVRPPIDIDALAAGDGVAVATGGTQLQPQFIRMTAGGIDAPRSLRSIDFSATRIAWTGTWFAVVIGVHPVRVTAGGEVLDDPDVAPVPARIDELLWAGGGLVAVTYDELTGRPLLTFAVPFPKLRGLRRP